MEGGSRGTFLELRFPIFQVTGAVMVRTTALFAYEANIHGIDIIIMGYPFFESLWFGSGYHQGLPHVGRLPDAK